MQYYNHKKYFQTAYPEESSKSKQGKCSMSMLLMGPAAGTVAAFNPQTWKPCLKSCFHEKEYLIVSYSLLIFYTSPNRKHRKNPGIQSWMKR